ncbi:MAG: FtsX-like permease family protein [Spirochaetia bacterium]|nr:FtsX-like permease family protein [Spirochaetia bacterium]
MEVVENLIEKQGKISLVEVSALCNDCPIEELVSQISSVMPGVNARAIRQVMEQRMLIIDKISSFTWAISFILIILCGLIIFSTVSGSISERKKEIGIFRALGFSKSHIIQIILSESLIISVTAGIAGSITAVGTSYLLLPALSDIDVAGMIFNKFNFLIGIFGVTALGTATSWWPAVSASNIDPVSTINSL